MLTPVSEFMTKQPWTISSHATITDASRLMREHAVKHLPVLDRGNVVGVVSDRDIKTLKAGQFSGTTRIREAIMETPYVVMADAPVADVARHMSDHNPGAAIVMSTDGDIAGIFTAVDAFRALAKLAH